MALLRCSVVSVLLLSTMTMVDGAENWPDKVQRCLRIEFMRRCGSPKYRYNITALECARECDERENCEIVQWHPPYQVWSDEARSICFQFDKNEKICDWGGAETASYHPGAVMYKCWKTRCGESQMFTRFCGAAIRYIYGTSFEDCFKYCSGHSNCMVGHWHPPYQIWSDEGRSVCFVFKANDENTRVCKWHGAELIGYHPGAKMLRCTETGGMDWERCYDDQANYARYCSNEIERINDINMEMCRQKCNDMIGGDNVCMRANWFKGADSRPVCVLFGDSAETCENSGDANESRLYSCHAP